MRQRRRETEERRDREEKRQRREETEERRDREEKRRRKSLSVKRWATQGQMTVQLTPRQVTMYSLQITSMLRPKFLSVSPTLHAPSEIPPYPSHIAIYRFGSSTRGPVRSRPDNTQCHRSLTPMADSPPSHDVSTLVIAKCFVRTSPPFPPSP